MTQGTSSSTSVSNSISLAAGSSSASMSSSSSSSVSSVALPAIAASVSAQTSSSMSSSSSSSSATSLATSFSSLAVIESRPMESEEKDAEMDTEEELVTVPGLDGRWFQAFTNLQDAVKAVSEDGFTVEEASIIYNIDMVRLEDAIRYAQAYINSIE